MSIDLSIVKGYYDVLGIAPGSGNVELKQAYIDQMLVWHPDRFPTNKRLQMVAENRSKVINEAFSFLKAHHNEYGADTLFHTWDAKPVDNSELGNVIAGLKRTCRRYAKHEQEMSANLEALSADLDEAERRAQRAREEAEWLKGELADVARWRDYWAARMQEMGSAQVRNRYQTIKFTVLTASGALALGFMSAAWFMEPDTGVLVAVMVAFVFGTLTRYGLTHLRLNASAFRTAPESMDAWPQNHSEIPSGGNTLTDRRT